MSKYIPGNQKHLTLENRIYIENELNKGATFKDIAKFLCKDPTTISKEVKAHRLSDWYHKGTLYNAQNFCVHRYHCRKTYASRLNAAGLPLDQIRACLGHSNTATTLGYIYNPLTPEESLSIMEKAFAS